MRSERLTAADKNFFSQVAAIVFMNPFSAEREAILSRLIAGRAQQPGTPKDEIERLTEQMRAGTIAADELLRGYLTLLHRRFGT